MVNKRLIMTISTITVLCVAYGWWLTPLTTTSDDVKYLILPNQEKTSEVDGFASPKSASLNTLEAATVTEIVEAESGLRLTPSGDLMFDSGTRTVVEKLANVAELSDLNEVREEIHRVLPPSAAATVSDLIERYFSYQIALADRTLPTERAASSSELAFALDQLHSIRVEYFGPELAQLWFAEEEKIGRAFINDQRAKGM